MIELSTASYTGYHGKQLPEISDFIVTENTDQETYQNNYTRTWSKVFGKLEGRTPGDKSELQSSDLEKIPEFEQRISTQYADIF